ncbi:reverse transcriptase-like protein [Lederbergia sp. NSJ-179]|uniref:reverse transcriptase-like protein n=1 Tax=Lederbergia sp. NSJ-179 TaxID=2931402 RepID=UPI001FD4B83B|nr:reverse transcriptase-like protein [Lederbergia sp. NSJ-179]MCJ7839510.1 reverse transcriptase-like protein [Lederbergia sp. NSJ-179]
MLEVYIDGASAGNPGVSGAGIFIKQDGKTQTFSFPLGEMDNHEAEFHALLKALEICDELGGSIISIKSDSSAVVQAVEKQFVRNEKYRPLLNQILAMIGNFDLFFIKWVPSKENKQADLLAKKAIRLNK